MTEFIQSFEDEFGLDFSDFDLDFSRPVVDSAEGQSYYNDGSNLVGFAGPSGITIIKDHFKDSVIDANLWTITGATISAFGGLTSAHVVGATQSIKTINTLDIISRVGKIRIEGYMYYVPGAIAGINFIGLWGSTADTWIGLFYNNGTGGSEKWYAAVSNEGTETQSSTFSISGETWRTFKIDVTHNIVKFYVNNVRVATISTNIKKDENFYMFAQSAHAGMDLYLDYFYCTYLPIPP